MRYPLAMRVIALLAAGLVLAGCAQFRDACPSGMREMWQAQLLFGRNVGASLGVSEDDWQAFVTAEIAPRFPSGFTVVDASGVWRSEDGSTVREPSKTVTIMATAGGETRARIDAVAAAYKLRFHQEAVGVIITPSCASF